MNITAELIREARRHGACEEGIAWAKKKPRTLEELARHNSDWAIWLVLNVPLNRATAAELYALVGCRAWWRDGKLHRDDGPAIEWHGRRDWYRRGKRHRDDGPAIERADGSREWWRNGLRHRDGQAAQRNGRSARRRRSPHRRAPKKPTCNARRPRPRQPGPRITRQTSTSPPEAGRR